MPFMEEYLHEACVGFCGNEDPSSEEYQEAKLVLEGKNQEKKEYIEKMVAEITKWTKASSIRNQEIFDTKGDITKFDVDLGEVINQLRENGKYDSFELSRMRDRTSKHLASATAIYTHFKLHKTLYVNAFKNDVEMVKNIYVSGTWLLISYLSAICTADMTNSKYANIIFKYEPMMNDFAKIIRHPKYVEYMETAEGNPLHTEGLMFESGVLAIGATLVSMVVALRLIAWNIYTMRTKISDKLKVTADYLDKNAKRLRNTDKKNKDKIADRQDKAVLVLNKAAETLRIKMDDEKVSKPEPPKKPAKGESNTSPKKDTGGSTTTSTSDDDDDFIL